jgi:CheY-like chemotaxis protein
VSTLWDVFAEVRATLDKTQRGLGIGLSLVKKLVELHSSSVEVASAGPGRGSAFTVRLPLAAAATSAAAAAPLLAVPRAAGRRVLVVDDNVDGAESLTMLLAFAGHEVATAHSGSEAVEAAGAFGPEVVLCDIELPGFDGYEVARRLRAGPRTSGATLVARTGWGSADDKRKSREAGFDLHLTKPVEAEALADALARAGAARE